LVSGDHSDRFYGSDAPEPDWKPGPEPESGSVVSEPGSDLGPISGRGRGPDFDAFTTGDDPCRAAPDQAPGGPDTPAAPAAFVSTYGRGAKRARPLFGRKPKLSSGPGSPPGDGSGTPAPAAAAKPRRRRRWVRITTLTVLVLVLALIGTGIGTWLWASSKISHAGTIAGYTGRPAQGGGTNWLIVGSDSRSTLTPAQRNQYHVGSDQGLNTDTMLLLHYGATGPDLISIPRDSYVTIPAYTDSSGKAHSSYKSKINSAYSAGGVQLLIETVEMATGVRIDHYLEIGFLGVVNVVDSVGGVNLCLASPVKDSHSGANLPAGCQTLDGAQSLELIRTRYSLANSDISRMANQQKFVVGLAHAALRPGVLLDPFTFYPFTGATLDSIAVDNGTGLWDLMNMSWHSRSLGGGKGTVGTVPIANEGYQVSGLGSTVLWNAAKAQQVFAAVNQDAAIPSGLLNSLG
jgi:LCP family protein required for cell wall assembly